MQVWEGKNWQGEEPEFKNTPSSMHNTDTHDQTFARQQHPQLKKILVMGLLVTLLLTQYHLPQ